MNNEKGADMELDGSDKGVWPRLAAIVAAMGAAGAYIVTNWAQVEPILSSPAVVLFAMFMVFGLGGLSVYWLVGRPLEKRLEKAEGVIKRMRDRERELEAQIADLRVELTEFRTILKMSGLMPIGDLGTPPSKDEPNASAVPDSPSPSEQ